MMLDKDKNLTFPHILIVKASAGSGKTEALTRRYVQFLLSECIPSSNLKNLLAITFSNNAADEMRKRILKTLKNLYFRDEKTLGSFLEILSLKEDQISKKAFDAISQILENYSDLQICTIDSFMAKVFRAEAINFNYPPEIEISFAERKIKDYALDLYLDNILLSTEGISSIEKVLSLLESQKNSYLWNPKKELLKKMERLLSFFAQTPSKMQPFYEFHVIEKLKGAIKALISEFLHKSKECNLNFRSPNLESKLSYVLSADEFTHVLEIYGKKLPIKMPEKGEKNKKEAYEALALLWQKLQDAISEFAPYYSLLFYQPYLEVFKDFCSILEDLKRKEGRIFIEDINRKVSENLSENIVPDIYFRLGDSIYHFFIDEFQDTSPIQWYNLKPLIENSLSFGGSLFVVGDTKQAIYTFRGADYTIMKNLENENPFFAAKQNKILKKLDVNWRSKETIVRFVENLFQKNEILRSSYLDALKLSGLDDVSQKANRKEDGYVEIERIPSNEREALKEYILSRIRDLQKRGYTFRDIAIIARKNDEITYLASILNEEGIPFVSFSSLDIRFKKIVHEILSLVFFLYSPTDDFSFATFIMGDIFRSFPKKMDVVFEPEELFIEKRKLFRVEPLYKIFQKKYPDLWESYFEKIFRLAGYLPLYDILCLIYDEFNLFNLFPSEEATLLKLLEITSDFEAKGHGNFMDFMNFFLTSESDRGIFDISLPKNTDTVTLMTVHKSKGLGFPVVIFYLEGFDLAHFVPNEIVHDDGENFCIMKLTKTISRCNSRLEEIRVEKEKSTIADFLNLLYVGFTRAEDELYVICSVKDDFYFPFDFLKLEFGKSYGKKEIKENRDLTSIEAVSLQHERAFLSFESQKARTKNIEEQKRGEFIHRILAQIEFKDAIDRDKIKRRASLEAFELNYSGDFFDDTQKVLGIVESDRLSFIFEKRPQRLVKNEFEICDADGNLCRIDRLIIDPDEVIVVEYKTGEIDEEHKKQISRYVRLVSSIFEKKARGLILYIDKEKEIFL